MPGEGVVVVAVPWAAQQALLDRAFAERAALVRAVVVERAVAVADTRERQGAVARHDGSHPAVVEVSELRDLVPLDCIHRFPRLRDSPCPGTVSALARTFQAFRAEI